MPLVFLQSTSMQTITLVPQFFVGEFNNDQTKILASAVIDRDPRGSRLPVPAAAVRARAHRRRRKVTAND